METNSSISKIRFNYFDIGFLIFAIFIFFRPLTLAVPYDIIQNYYILELFSITFSYLFIFVLLFNLQRVKIDKISFLIFLYCAYVGFSFLWGSSMREVGRMTLPFVVFFYARMKLDDDKKIKILLAACVIGYIYPLIGSAISILAGYAGVQLVWHSGVMKSSGILSEIHSYGHAMLFFSFLYTLFLQTIEEDNRRIRIFLFCLVVLSTFCLYKSSVRTVYLGYVVFWGIYLLAMNRKFFVIFVFALLCFIVANQLYFEKVFWQTTDPKARSLDSASSGRISIWKHNLSVYNNDYSLDQKIFGIGLGKEGQPWHIGKKGPYVKSSHGDYLSLLMGLGPIGLMLYLFLYLILMYDIFLSAIDIKLRIIFIGVLFSVIVMNLVSNSYIVRVELAQYFWLFMGIFYALNDNLRRTWQKHF
jgi:hypothetical protein